jgi:hypothetical protein
MLDRWSGFTCIRRPRRLSRLGRDIELFDVNVSNPSLDGPGTYQVSYSLVGGLDGSAQDNLSSATSSVNYLLGLVSAVLILASKMTRLNA